jgi:tetratricopeptide (TPR) repeat protein
VAAQPASAEAWRGLLLAQSQAGSGSLALATAQRTPAAVQAQLQNDPRYLQVLASVDSAAGRNGDAQKALDHALGLPLSADAKGLKTDLQLQLGGVLVALHQPDQAAALYRQVLDGESGNIAAWKGLVAAVGTKGDDKETLAIVEGMPAATRETAMLDPAFAVTVAALCKSQNELEAAQDLLQKTITQETNAGQKPATAVEMALADIDIQRGQPQLAYPIYQQVLREAPARADAWAGLLTALHLTGHDNEALAQVQLIPAAARAQLETNLDYLQTMASVYEGQGRSREAAPYLHRAEQDYAAQHTTPPAKLEIENAWLLYNGMDDAGLYHQLMSLGARTDLTEAERTTVQTIWTNWAVRRASQAAAAGNSPRAQAILNAAAQSFPDNPAVLRELASGYAQAGQPQQAVLIYKAQNMTAASSADYQTAVSAALAAGDNKDAEIWLRYGLAKYPADPQILLLGAQFEQARGDTTRAMKYYRASLKALPPANAGTPATLPGGPAPVTLPGAAPAQELSMLLAPATTDAIPAGAPQSGAYAPTDRNPNHAPAPLPPQLTNPAAPPEGDGSGLGPQTRVAPDAPTDQPAVQSAVAATENSTPPTAAQTPPAARVAVPNETYRPYVGYIAPPRPVAPVAGAAPGSSAAVAVELGNSTPPPVTPPTEMTDVLPTARYVPSNRKSPSLASDPNAAAAQAARVRRQQEGAARTGQSHPPSDISIAGAQISQPPSPPASSSGGVPDTGTQQYPQPRTQPGTAGTVTRARQASPATAPAPAAQAVALPTEPASAAPAPAQPAPVPPVANPAENSSAVSQPINPYPLSAPPTDAELAARNLPPLHGAFGSQAPMSMTPRQQAADALAALEGSYSGWFGGTGIGRYRSGTAGLDRLYDVEAPVEVSAVIGHSVRLTAVALPVFLDSGALGAFTLVSGNIPYLGTLAAYTANPPAQQFSSGIGGELQLTTRNIGLAAGYTPYEFRVHNFTGRFGWRPLGGHLSLFAERAPVRDTQLSYAGLRDPGVSPVTGPIWGGVLATTDGVRLDFGNSGGASSFYITGEGGVLAGRHVLDNYRYGGTAGANLRVGNWPGHGSLVLGEEFSGMHYANNEVGLTYGQGGYFSPGYYFQAAVPITFNGNHNANFHYMVRGALGVQTFREDVALFYPLDPVLQNGFAPCSAAQAPSYNCGEYPMTAATAFNYSVDSEASYRFAGHWYGGGFLYASNANNYNAVSAGFFLRLTFRGQQPAEGRGTGLFPVRGFRPLQVP